MATTDSNDSADIFWPGYVDAISNLAINLLFVIAVMAIVVIGATLQLSELMKRKDTTQGEDVVFAVSPSSQTMPGSSAVDPKPSGGAAADAVDALQARLAAQEETIREQRAEIRRLQSKAAPVTAAAAESTRVPQDRVEVVHANNPAPAPEGKSASEAVQGGVVVHFAANVTQLVDAEMKDLVEKLLSFAPLDAKGRWHITVVAQKGFSEAVRLGFYRANAVRNVLLQQGVPGVNIDLRVIESDRGDANNARVIVRPAQ